MIILRKITWETWNTKDHLQFNVYKLQWKWNKEIRLKLLFVWGDCLVPRLLSLDENVRAKEGGKETTPAVCTLPMVPCGSSPVAPLPWEKQSAWGGGWWGDMFTLYRKEMSRHQNYWIRLLFTHKNGDYRAISRTKRSCYGIVTYRIGFCHS